MHIVIKSEADIEKMRIAGRLAAELLDMITEHVVAGVTTNELDRICHDYMVNVQGTIPATINYGHKTKQYPNGYPKSICTSINHVICHGIPADKKLKNGDIINIDVTVIKDLWHGDTSRMYVVGKIPGRTQKLIDVTKECMEIGICMVAPGVQLGDIGFAIAEHARIVRIPLNKIGTISKVNQAQSRLEQQLQREQIYHQLKVVLLIQLLLTTTIQATEHIS